METTRWTTETYLALTYATIAKAGGSTAELERPTGKYKWRKGRGKYKLSFETNPDGELTINGKTAPMHQYMRHLEYMNEFYADRAKAFVQSCDDNAIDDHSSFMYADYVQWETEKDRLAPDWLFHKLISHTAEGTLPGPDPETNGISRYSMTIMHDIPISHPEYFIGKDNNFPADASEKAKARFRSINESGNIEAEELTKTVARVHVYDTYYLYATIKRNRKKRAGLGFVMDIDLVSLDGHRPAKTMKFLRIEEQLEKSAVGDDDFSVCSDKAAMSAIKDVLCRSLLINFEDCEWTEIRPK